MQSQAPNPKTSPATSHGCAWAKVPRPDPVRATRADRDTCPMTPPEFAAKWKGSQRTERAAAQEHFIDLCRMLGEPTPDRGRPDGRLVRLREGRREGQRRRRLRRRLEAGPLRLGVQGQAQGPRGRLPPALATARPWRTRRSWSSATSTVRGPHQLHGTDKTVHAITLDDLRPRPRRSRCAILRAVFTDPDALRPAEPAQSHRGGRPPLRRARPALRARPRPAAGRPLPQSAPLLPVRRGHRPAAQGLLSPLVEATQRRSRRLRAPARQLFGAMAKGGGLLRLRRVDWFNGGLFDERRRPPADATRSSTLLDVGRLDWAWSSRPSSARSSSGPRPRSAPSSAPTTPTAPTSARLVEPVVMEPLRRECAAMQARVDGAPAAGRERRRRRPGRPRATRRRSSRPSSTRCARVRVLDPACGSGNFLYVALWALKDLENEAIQLGLARSCGSRAVPGVGPEAVLGIEINPYAAELARVTIWIGEIQWMLDNGFAYRATRSSSRSTTSRCRDALLDLDRPGAARARPSGRRRSSSSATRRSWAASSCGEDLGDEYVDAAVRPTTGACPREADLVRLLAREGAGGSSRAHAAGGPARDPGHPRRGQPPGAGAHQGDRRHLPRLVRRAVGPGRRDVRITIVGQDDGTETERMLDGRAGRRHQRRT